MTPTRPEIMLQDARGIDRAADLLRSGGLVAFATETVYGLGACADDDRAVAAIFGAKDRPRFNPLIVHLPDMDVVERYCAMNDPARRLARAFWPGPLTLVLPLVAGAGVSPLVTAGLDSLAVRVPAHEGARALLRAVGQPVAAPSANPSGKISPTTAQHVAEGLRGRIDAVLDGGECAVGVESTIVSCLGPPRLLRAGGVTAEDIAGVLGKGIEVGAETSDAPLAPGQLASHYAPRGTVRLNAKRVREGEVLLGFGPVEGAEVSLSPVGDLQEAAARLFACLHHLNEMGASQIAVSPIPEVGLGRAINDRLRRAAAPRPKG